MTEKEFAMLDVLCAGQAVVDCITRGKETDPYKENVYRADTIHLHTGGDAVNESMALASMGYDTAVICCLGNDLAGDLVFRELESAGIHTDRISRLSVDTPVANLQVASDGSRISVNSHAVRLEGYQIDPALLTGAKVISFASLFRPPLEKPQIVTELIRAAKKSGAVICADTKLPVTGAVSIEEFSEILTLIDYFFPNEKEAAYYSGMKTYADMAHAFRERGIRNVIVKTGKDGCYVSGEEGEFALPAIPVEKVLDTTGAGDNFVAGFISGILEKDTLYRCAQKGTERAARVITRIGGNL